jgi:hypothetical protein
VASEELIKMWKVNRRTDDRRSVVTIAHLTLWVRWAKNRTGTLLKLIGVLVPFMVPDLVYIFQSICFRGTSSVNFSHFNQLLWSHWANLNQTLVEWSLDGSLPKLCPVIPTSNQDGHQTKNRKKGGMKF